MLQRSRTWCVYVASVCKLLPVFHFNAEPFVEDSSCTSLVILQLNALKKEHVPPPGGVSSRSSFAPNKVRPCLFGCVSSHTHLFFFFSFFVAFSIHGLVEEKIVEVYSFGRWKSLEELVVVCQERFGGQLYHFGAQRRNPASGLAISKSKSQELEVLFVFPFFIVHNQ